MSCQVKIEPKSWKLFWGQWLEPVDYKGAEFFILIKTNHFTKVCLNAEFWRFKSKVYTKRCFSQCICNLR